MAAALRVLVVQGGLVAADRRITVVAEDLGGLDSLKRAVLAKLRLGAAAEAGGELCEWTPDGPIAIGSLAQLGDKCKLQVVLRQDAPPGEAAAAPTAGAEEAEDARRARMKTAFALVAEDATDSPMPAAMPAEEDGGAAGDSGVSSPTAEAGEEVPGTTFTRYLLQDI